LGITKEGQVARCPYHNTLLGPQRAAAAAAAAGPHPPTGHAAGSSLCPPRGGPALSLFTDYSAGLEALPSQCVQVVAEHRDEVWHCAFSHSGQRLATAGKVRTSAPSFGLGSPPKLGVGAASRVGGGGAAAGQGGARPWPLAMLHVLSGHPAPVAFVSWSPDDRLLLTLSDDRVLCWEAASGQCCQTFSHHREAVTCCAWLPDSRRFATGSVDKMVCLMSVTGEELARWKRPYRVQDLAVSADGRCLVIAASDRHIHVLRLSDLREISLAESAPITCLALSADSVHLLVNLQPPSGPSLEYCQAADSASGTPRASAGRFVLRSSLGGAAATFVVQGSEDGRVAMWHRDSGALLLQLTGHTGSVNAVAWNPAQPAMMASVGDDATIRVWVSEAALAGPSNRRWSHLNA
ncbi:WD40-repeat-containing domain protein, partial [Haematococcus lacustris]